MKNHAILLLDEKKSSIESSDGCVGAGAGGSIGSGSAETVISGKLELTPVTATIQVETSL